MRWVLGVVGAAAVLGSLFGLTLPLSLQAVDRSGAPIACGTGFHPDHRRAAREDAVNRDLHTGFGAHYELSDYRAQCDALVSARRNISVNVAVFGGALLATSCLLALRAAGYIELSRPSGSRPTPTKQPAGQWLVPSASPSAVRYHDDLSTALATIGIRPQH
ncbi:hypothetical protein [Mycobacterium gordonae]|uniref:hypothetical protein n=1 Tax=Mycobacterium gordonae TaxID=1778 RepID=UPI000B110F7B|nr:hypothetical protein [Mycobacterium gordonae]MBI2702024.1 hypothetical protein [Mycobacterium sp.]MBX9978172.1 hypothetical protein [Mycobacterium gordonae]MCQ4360557.1 hypothetical protein [Mycobacterium gordonae]MCV7007365.1 hypothetical protein [Mycobacterium gordonae]